jgi:hypothetical protein
VAIFAKCFIAFYFPSVFITRNPCNLFFHVSGRITGYWSGTFAFIFSKQSFDATSHTGQPAGSFADSSPNEKFVKYEKNEKTCTFEDNDENIEILECFNIRQNDF